MQVLVADDDPVYRSVLKEYLTKWGFDVTECIDGEQAWEVMQQLTPPRLLILDWVMPQLDGCELCRRIRQHGRHRDVYILIVTGSLKKQEMMKIVLAGADDYLIKPFDELDLKIHLRTATRVLGLQDDLERARGGGSMPVGRAG